MQSRTVEHHPSGPGGDRGTGQATRVFGFWIFARATVPLHQRGPLRRIIHTPVFAARRAASRHGHRSMWGISVGGSRKGELSPLPRPAFPEAPGPQGTRLSVMRPTVRGGGGRPLCGPVGNAGRSQMATERPGEIHPTPCVKTARSGVSVDSVALWRKVGPWPRSRGRGMVSGCAACRNVGLNVDPGFLKRSL